MLLIFFHVLILLTILILTSKIKIDINKVELSNINKKLSVEYNIYFKVYIFKFIRILRIKINGDKQIKQIVNKINANNLNKHKISISKLGIIKKNLLKFKYIDINLSIGTIDNLLSVYVVTLLAIIIPIIFRNDNLRYKTNPLYNMENKIKLTINCIIEIKFVHIIYVIFIIYKKRGEQNGGKRKKAPYRRTYEYSDE